MNPDEGAVIQGSDKSSMTFRIGLIWTNLYEVYIDMEWPGSVPERSKANVKINLCQKLILNRMGRKLFHLFCCWRRERERSKFKGFLVCKALQTR